uniref:Golgi associated RAB2 interactor protein-like Rab2B-binding domain-containing protein n=1 Tax=Gopherus evgoodei TaxID=1825980 RepID=A0A8C4YHN1_9SAUR
ISIMGDLQRVLSKGEYAPFTSAPMFESNFVQVNRRGEAIYVHNRPNCVTVGICASSPSLSLPNVMLLAHTVPTSSQEAVSKPWKTLAGLTPVFSYRFFPLKFVEITVHNAEKRRLKLKLASGRSFYLELCAPPGKQCLLFRQWLRLISLLKLPQDQYNNTQTRIAADPEQTFERCYPKLHASSRDFRHRHLHISLFLPLPCKPLLQPGRRAMRR